MKKEPIDWITINGNHVPIFEGETKEQAAKRFVEDKKSVKVGDQDVRISKNKKRVNQEDLTDQRIVSEIAGEDSYANDPEYQEILNKTSEAWEKKWDIKDRIKQLNEELAAESSEKPEEEWDVNDEILALLGEKPSKYTDKGQQISEEISRLREEGKGYDEEWEHYTNELKKRDVAQREIGRQKYLMSSDDSISTDLKDDYFGFSKSETTTPYIDQLLENGDAFVVEMSPKTYLQECAYKIFEREDTTLETTLRGTSTKDIAKYMTMMEEGVKFNTPYLNYRDKEQEGRHRAIAAYMLGVDKIPVVIVRKRR